MSDHLIGPVLLALAVLVACLLAVITHAIERRLHRHVHRALDPAHDISHVRVVPEPTVPRRLPDNRRPRQEHVQ